MVWNAIVQAWHGCCTQELTVALIPCSRLSLSKGRLSAPPPLSKTTVEASPLRLTIFLATSVWFSFFHWAWIPFCGVGFRSSQGAVGCLYNSHGTMAPVGHLEGQVSGAVLRVHRFVSFLMTFLPLQLAQALAAPWQLTSSRFQLDFSRWFIEILCFLSVPWCSVSCSQ